MTECTQESFEFTAHFSREVVARFDGGSMTSDGGALLLREAERRVNLLARLARCFDDRRKPWLIEHSVAELVAQRVYGLALGYEDLSDHDELRSDPLLAVLSGKRAAGERSLAGKSTLNRLELSTEKADRYKKIECHQAAIDELLVRVFVEAHNTPPASIVLDLDATDLPLYGHQEGRFFHGYYDEYCYLPLYIFAGEHLLCARLRTADQDAAAGATQEVERIVARIRAAWPETAITVRADSGFCREELMQWCETNSVHYVLGCARNERAPQGLGSETARRTAAVPDRVHHHGADGRNARRGRGHRHRKARDAGDRNAVGDQAMGHLRGSGGFGQRGDILRRVSGAQGGQAGSDCGPAL